MIIRSVILEILMRLLLLFILRDKFLFIEVGEIDVSGFKTFHFIMHSYNS